MNRVHELFLKEISRTEDLLTRKSDTNTVLNGLGSATDTFRTFLMQAFNSYIVWIIAAVIVVILAIQIAKCVGEYKQNHSFQDRVMPIAVTIIVLVLELSFPTWGWQMIGWK